MLFKRKRKHGDKTYLNFSCVVSPNEGNLEEVDVRNLDFLRRKGNRLDSYDGLRECLVWIYAVPADEFDELIQSTDDIARSIEMSTKRGLLKETVLRQIQKMQM